MIPPHVALYPPAKKPKVIENRTKMPMLPFEVKPHNKKADRAELMAEIEVTVVAERENRFLSLR